MVKKKNVTPPKWFNLEKYAFLTNLPSRLLCHEFYIRQQQWNFINGEIIQDATVEEKMTFMIWIKSSINCAREGGQAHFLDYDLAKHLRNEFSDYSELENFFGASTPVNTLNFSPTSPNKQRKPVCGLTFADIHKNFLIPKSLADIFDENMHNLNQFFYNLNHIFESNVFSDLENIFDEVYVEGKEKFDEIVGLVNSLDVNTLKDEMVLPKPKNFDGSIDEYFDRINFIIRNASLEINLLETRNDLFMKVDLLSPNHVLLNEIIETIYQSRLLNEVESVDGIIERFPKNKKNGGIKILKSMIEQRIIPYIDLLIWEKENNFDLSDEWFLKRIFGDFKSRGVEYQHNKINTTVRPLTKKCLNSSWLKSFYSFDLNSYEDYFPRSSFLE